MQDPGAVDIALEQDIDSAAAVGGFLEGNIDADFLALDNPLLLPADGHFETLQNQMRNHRPL